MFYIMIDWMLKKKLVFPLPKTVHLKYYINIFLLMLSKTRYFKFLKTVTVLW